MEFKVCVGVCCWEVKNINPGYFNLPDTISFLSIASMGLPKKLEKFTFYLQNWLELESIKQYYQNFKFCVGEKQ